MVVADCTAAVGGAQTGPDPARTADGSATATACRYALLASQRQSISTRSPPSSLLPSSFPHSLRCITCLANLCVRSHALDRRHPTEQPIPRVGPVRRAAIGGWSSGGRAGPVALPPAGVSDGECGGVWGVRGCHAGDGRVGRPRHGAGCSCTGRAARARRGGTGSGRGGGAVERAVWRVWVRGGQGAGAGGHVWAGGRGERGGR